MTNMLVLIIQHSNMRHERDLSRLHFSVKIEDNTQRKTDGERDLRQEMKVKKTCGS
jgi:hypothetical protein